MYSPYQVVIDKHIQTDLLQNINSSNQNEDKTGLLPIPFDRKSMIYRDQSRNESFNDRDVSMTNNHLYINYTPQERLALHEYALEQSRSLGFNKVKENSSMDISENEIVNPTTNGK